MTTDQKLLLPDSIDQDRVSKLRRFVTESYQILFDQDVAGATAQEHAIYIASLNLLKFDPENIDTERFELIYQHFYMKIYSLLKQRSGQSSQNFAILNPEDSRETLRPEKWTALYNKRTKDLDSLKSMKKKGIHQCQKCKSWYTSYQQLQTASADESMRVSVVCLDCNWHWKYS
jgi:DNA-directed RNA polymerase subunit M/transcription elongation factor TFIIS